MSLDTWIHCAATLIAIFGLLLVWRQLRLGHRQTRFQALTDLHRELLATDMQRALRFIFSNKPDRLACPRSEEELEQIELVLNAYDLIAFRVREGVLPRQETLKTERRILLCVWKQLEEFIKRQRELRQDDSYKKHLESFVLEAKKHPTTCDKPVKLIHKREVMNFSLESTKTAIVAGDFSIDFGISVGDLETSSYCTKDILVVRIDGQFKPADPVADVITAQWDRIMRIAGSRKQDLRDGPLCRLDSYAAWPDGKMCLLLQETSYKVFSTTNLMLDRFMVVQPGGTGLVSIRELGNGNVARAAPYLANPLNVIAMVVTKDGYTFLPRRNMNVLESPGKRQASVGGAVKPDEGEDPTKALVRELEEEWGSAIKGEDVKIDVEFLALGINQRTGEPDLIGMVRINRTAEDLEKSKDFPEFQPGPGKYAFGKGDSIRELDEMLKLLVMEEDWSQPSDQAALLLALIREFSKVAVEEGLKKVLPHAADPVPLS